MAGACPLLQVRVSVNGILATCATHETQCFYEATPEATPTITDVQETRTAGGTNISLAIFGSGFAKDVRDNKVTVAEQVRQSISSVKLPCKDW